MSWTAERWHEVQGLFVEALEKPPAEQQAWVENRAADDADLCSEVLRLLASAADDQALEIESLLAPDDPLAGRKVGAYRLLDTLGQGGTARVYRAVRIDQEFDHEVAVKVLQPGLRRHEMEVRLRTERQILARLNHPNIAALFDGGVLDDGMPYLVMELIDGRTLTDHCDHHSLGIEERIRLFRTVCEAVHHAHRRLIVHRDLKPSNILVSREGEVRLLDFGIAKLLDPDDMGLDVQETRTERVLLTPEYAAPEQVYREGITTATDVYSLGLVLYELMAGWHPQRLQGVSRRDLEAHLRREPEKPSVAVARLANEEAAAKRGLDSRRLVRRLDGDLDNIVLKALRREPEQRYASADELAADLGRHLAGMPIEARADSLPYRLRKFVGRNRLRVAAALVLAASLVVFALVSALQARVIAAERDSATAQRDRAQQVSELLLQLFDADPYGTSESSRGELTVREFLEQSEIDLRSSLEGQPALSAELLNLLARMYGNLGDFERGLQLARESVDLRRTALAPGDPALAESLDELGTILAGRGDYDEAEAAMREALALRERAFGPRHLEVAKSLNNLDVLLGDAGRAGPENLELAVRSLEIKREILGDDHLEVAQGLNNLGVRYYEGEPRDLERSESLYREALAIRRQQLGDEHPLVANTRSNLANLLHEMGRLEEAESEFKEAIRVWRGALGDQHPRLSAGLYGLHDLLLDRDRLAEAETALQECMAIDQATLPADHPHVAVGYFSLGLLLRRADDLDGSRQAFEQALAINRQRFGPEHETTLQSHFEVGRAAWLLGDRSSAREILIQAKTLAAGAREPDWLTEVLAEVERR